jgi:hypothetical protein
MLLRQQIDRISGVLQNENITLSDLVCAYIQGATNLNPFTGYAYALEEEICSPAALTKIIQCLVNKPKTLPIVTRIARNLTFRLCILELNNILSPSAGFHFNVSHATPSRFHDFSSLKMANTFKNNCPTLWALFGLLLNAATVKNAAMSANKQGDCWMEITYQDIRQTSAHTNSQSQTPAETLADMPDEDWGDDLLDESWLDSEATDAMAKQTVAEGDIEWSTGAGTPRKKKNGNGFWRQLERSNLVSNLPRFC